MKWLGAGLAVLASLVLGWWGFAEYSIAHGQDRSPLDSVYLTFQLFVLESGAPPGAIPWQLGVRSRSSSASRRTGSGCACCATPS